DHQNQAGPGRPAAVDAECGPSRKGAGVELSLSRQPAWLLVDWTRIISGDVYIDPAGLRFMYSVWRQSVGVQPGPELPVFASRPRIYAGHQRERQRWRECHAVFLWWRIYQRAG